MKVHRQDQQMSSCSWSFGEFACYNQRDKLAAYARNGIGKYWIVDLTHNEVQIYRAPESSGYRTQLRFGMDEAVARLAFPEAPLRVQDILPR